MPHNIRAACHAGLYSRDRHVVVDCVSSGLQDWHLTCRTGPKTALHRRASVELCQLDVEDVLVCGGLDESAKMALNGAAKRRPARLGVDSLDSDGGVRRRFLSGPRSSARSGPRGERCSSAGGVAAEAVSQETPATAESSVGLAWIVSLCFRTEARLDQSVGGVAQPSPRGSSWALWPSRSTRGTRTRAA